MTTNITERHADQISGVLHCHDRILLKGTLPSVAYGDGMASFLRSGNKRIFDYPKIMEPLRENLRKNTEKLALQAGVKIQFIRSSRTRKESIVKEILSVRGEHPGLVCILSAMERCPSFLPWHDKKTKHTSLKYKQAKCCHFYFYFIDPDLGLCYMRVPSWAPFGLQFYFNGHNLLASRLSHAGINYRMLDNSFEMIDDFTAAQKMADKIDCETLNKKLDYYAERYCPVHRYFNQNYHWTVMQIELATDIVFKKEQDLQDIYEDIVRGAVLSVKVENVATFLGKRLTTRFNQEAGTRFNTLIEGTRIKHQMGKNTIKMYDKFNKILRIETTSNDVTTFNIFRTVNHRDGTSETKWAPACKSIYYLNAVSEIMQNANERYIDHISAIEEHKIGRKNLARVTSRVVENNRPYRGFNFFDEKDMAVLKVIVGGEFNIGGFRNSDIRNRISGKSTGQISRLIKRMRTHGVIRKIAGSYKYAATKLGKNIIHSIMRVKELHIIPQLNT